MVPAEAETEAEAEGHLGEQVLQDMRERRGQEARLREIQQQLGTMERCQTESVSLESPITHTDRGASTVAYSLCIYMCAGNTTHPQYIHSVFRHFNPSISYLCLHSFSLHVYPKWPLKKHWCMLPLGY